MQSMIATIEEFIMNPICHQADLFTIVSHGQLLYIDEGQEEFDHNWLRSVIRETDYEFVIEATRALQGNKMTSRMVCHRENDDLVVVEIHDLIDHQVVTKQIRDDEIEC